MNYIPSRPLEETLRRLPSPSLLERLSHVQRLGDERWMRYFDDAGQARRIEMAPRPWLISPSQFRFFCGVVRELVRCLARLPALHRALPEARRILPLSPAQERWLRLEPQASTKSLGVLGRIDATCPFSHPQWRSRLRFLEPNSVGVGGVYYAPTNSRIVAEVMGDVVQRAWPRHTFRLPPDPRRLLLDELRRLAKALRIRLQTVALIENTDYTSGMDEFGQLAEFLKRHGLKALVVDPRRLALRRGRIVHRAEQVDLIYRDCELVELIEMEEEGKRLAAMRQAFREGRVVSAASWEFDLKSAWEIFTSPQFARYFTKRQRAIFHHYVPWTRLLRQAFSSDPQGRRVDVIAFARRHKDHLVLKPNSLFGGEGVVVGETVSQAVWEKHLAMALRGSEPYVVQQAVPVARETFPRLVRERRIEWACVFTVCGFFFSSRGLGMAGRFSTDPIVNVSRGGGMVGVLLAS